MMRTSERGAVAVAATTRMSGAGRRVGDRLVGAMRRHWAAILLALCTLVVVAGQAIWIAMDRQPPIWDPAHYLDLTRGHADAFRAGGVGSFFADVVRADPVRAPLMRMLATPIFLTLGVGPDSALIVNLLLWPVLLAAVYALGRRYYDAKTGLLAAFLTAVIPILTGLGHDFYIEFLLTTLVVLTVLALAHSEGLTRPVPCFALGVCAGLGMLTKITFPLYLVGPGLVYLAIAVGGLARTERRGPRLLRFAGNAVLIVAPLVAIAAFWYGPNLQPSLAYAQWASNGTGSERFGPSDPFQPSEIAAWVIAVINHIISWLYLLLLVVALLLTAVFGRGVAPRMGGQDRSGGVGGGTRMRVIVPLVWFMVPFWYVGLSHNHDIRFLAPTVPAIAILMAVTLLRVPRPRPRRVLLACVVLLGVTQWFAYLFTVPGLPDMVVVRNSVAPAIFWLQGPNGLSYNHAPSGDWQVDEVLTWLARENPTPQGVRPLTIGVLDADIAFNPNTLRYYANARRLPFTFMDVRLDPADTAGASTAIVPPQVCDYLIVARKRADYKDPLEEFNRKLYASLHQSAARASDDRIARIFVQAPAVFPNPEGAVLLLARDNTALPTLTIAHPASAVFDNAIEFLGYDMVPYGKTAEGSVFTMTYYWRAIAPVSKDYQIFVHMLMPQGNRLVAGGDHNPASMSTGPTAGWKPGRVVQTSARMFVPNTLPPGEYPLRVGLHIPDVSLAAITSAPPGSASPDAMGVRAGVFVSPTP